MVQRISPLATELKPGKKLGWNGWNIALSYLGEREHNKLFITDLSHLQKWNAQSHDLGALNINGATVPAAPRQVNIENNIVAVRLTPTEAFILNLETSSAQIESTEVTDITESMAMFALVGPSCLGTLEKLSSVDLCPPNGPTPCAAQAPVEGLTSLLIYMKNSEGVPGLIVGVSRGFGHALYESFVDAGKEFGISAAGWKRFANWYSV